MTVVTIPAFGGSKRTLQGESLGAFYRELVERGCDVLALPDFLYTTVDDALTYVKQEIPLQRVVLLGFSIGASNGIYAGTKFPVGAVIADGGVDSLADDIFTDFKGNLLLTFFIPAFRIFLMRSRHLQARTLRALQTIPMLTCPVLLVYGKDEPMMDLGMNKGLISYASTHSQVDVCLLPDVSHAMGPTRETIAYVETVSAFLLHHGITGVGSGELDESEETHQTNALGQA